jgi:hypothetical protein
MEGILFTRTYTVRVVVFSKMKTDRLLGQVEEIHVPTCQLSFFLFLKKAKFFS